MGRLFFRPNGSSRSERIWLPKIRTALLSTQTPSTRHLQYCRLHSNAKLCASPKQDGRSTQLCGTLVSIEVWWEHALSTTTLELHPVRNLAIDLHNFSGSPNEGNLARRVLCQTRSKAFAISRLRPHLYFLQLLPNNSLSKHGGYKLNDRDETRIDGHRSADNLPGIKKLCEYIFFQDFGIKRDDGNSPILIWVWLAFSRVRSHWR